MLATILSRETLDFGRLELVQSRALSNHETSTNLVHFQRPPFFPEKLSPFPSSLKSVAGGNRKIAVHRVTTCFAMSTNKNNYWRHWSSQVIEEGRPHERTCL
jgi:hypothetical protein